MEGFGGDVTTTTLSAWRGAESSAPRRTRRVAILGFGKTVRDAPVSDPTWELWGMNGFWRAAKPDFAIDVPPERYALWFDMHTLEFTRDYGKRAGFGDAQNEWLKQSHPFRIFTLDEFGPEYPSTVRFPIERLIADMRRDYFTSSVAYEIAYAASLPDVAEIGLWGIDLIHDSEYADQRPCAEYWLGRAEERGIKVTRHEDSAVLRAHFRYGYEDEPEILKLLRDRLTKHGDKVHAAVQEREEQIRKAQIQNAADGGALQMIAGILEGFDGYRRGGRL